jgi:hypothetical protein
MKREEDGKERNVSGIGPTNVPTASSAGAKGKGNLLSQQKNLKRKQGEKRLMTTTKRTRRRRIGKNKRYINQPPPGQSRKHTYSRPNCWRRFTKLDF